MPNRIAISYLVKSESFDVVPVGSVIELPISETDALSFVMAKRAIRNEVAAAALLAHVPGISSFTVSSLMQSSWYSLASGE